MIEFLTDLFHEHGSSDAVVSSGFRLAYEDLLEEVGFWLVATADVPPGSVVAVEGDFTLRHSIPLFLALAERGCVLVPVSPGTADEAERLRVTGAGWCVTWGGSLERLAGGPDHPLLARLRAAGHPGLVLFSSGSSGRPKAALHDLSLLLDKFRTPRRRSRTISFLLFDHIGGFNTLLTALSNGGCIVVPDSHSPDAVLAAVERHRAEVLPVSPTFLNLLLASGAHRRHDLSSLSLVTYGTERMPESTLRAVSAELPGVRLLQTYGLSEVGIMGTRSRDRDTTWVRLGGEGFETRVTDEGLLEIRARSAMLGYLNAPSPFTDDGWFKTGDEVEVDGEYVRFLGRRSDVINVGGLKVHPTEVEDVVQGVTGVEDVVVRGERNALVGHVVVAVVKPGEGVDQDDLRGRIRSSCASLLDKHKRPARIQFTGEPLHTSRFKKARAKE